MTLVSSNPYFQTGDEMLRDDPQAWAEWSAGVVAWLDQVEPGGVHVDVFALEVPADDETEADEAADLAVQRRLDALCAASEDRFEATEARL